MIRKSAEIFINPDNKRIEVKNNDNSYPQIFPGGRRDCFVHDQRVIARTRAVRSKTEQSLMHARRGLPPLL